MMGIINYHTLYDFAFFYIVLTSMLGQWIIGKFIFIQLKKRINQTK